MAGDPHDVAEALVAGQIAVSERFASHFGVHQGDVVTLSTPKGPCDFRVAGVIRDYAGPAGSLNIDIDVFDRLWPLQGRRDVVFWTKGDPAAVIGQIQKISTSQRALVFSYGRSLAHFVTDQIWQVRGIMASIALMTALLGAVAIATLMLSNVTLLVRDRAVLIAIGATKAQIRLLTLLEGLSLGIGGGTAGIACGLCVSYLLIENVLPDRIGWRLDLSAGPVELGMLVLCLASVSLLASAYPAWISGDISPRAIADE
jgi:putative ABC transport system permease protein